MYFRKTAEQWTALEATGLPAEVIENL